MNQAVKFGSNPSQGVVDPCRIFFTEEDPAVAKKTLNEILIKDGLSEGLKNLTRQFDQIVGETTQSTVSTNYLERFRIARQLVSFNARKVKKLSLDPIKLQISQSKANKSFSKFVKKYARSIMRASCYLGHLELVKILHHEYKVALDLVDTQRANYSLLHYSVVQGHTPISLFLIRNGAPLDLKEATHDRTPLHLACEFGKEKEFAALVANGADVNALDNEGNTPMYLALSCKNQQNKEAEEDTLARAKIVMGLFANGADPLAKNKAQYNPADLVDKQILNRSIFKFPNPAVNSSLPPLPRDVWVLIFGILHRDGVDLAKTVKPVSKAFYNFAADALLIAFNNHTQ